jgi:hypothetical protein
LKHGRKERSMKLRKPNNPQKIWPEALLKRVTQNGKRTAYTRVEIGQHNDVSHIFYPAEMSFRDLLIVEEPDKMEEYFENRT